MRPIIQVGAENGGDWYNSLLFFKLNPVPCMYKRVIWSMLFRTSWIWRLLYLHDISWYQIGLVKEIVRRVVKTGTFKKDENLFHPIFIFCNDFIALPTSYSILYRVLNLAPFFCMTCNCSDCDLIVLRTIVVRKIHDFGPLRGRICHHLSKRGLFLSLFY